MERERVFRVVVRHNLVIAVESIEVAAPSGISGENLDVTLQLASNYRENGCIDGEYLFTSIHQAKDFALVALDFVKRLMEKSEQGLNAHNFYSEPDWHNPSAGKPQKVQH
jgi:hypothetical protein